MQLIPILQHAVELGASDVHLKMGTPPMVRLNGELLPMAGLPALTPDHLTAMAKEVLTARHREQLRTRLEADLSYGVPGLGRFRVNVFVQRGTLGMVLRAIPTHTQSLLELGLPPILEKIALENRGLVLVTGTTGSGKSTTLASMIDHINKERTAHIMTIEDPIEFLLADQRSIINQREVGSDTLSFSAALRSALRQDPDVILVGEMRDLETIETAIQAAETGHLVMSTLHTLDATETVTRIISVFPPHQQKQIRLQLASVLKAVISQRLVPTADGMGRVPAVEVMRSTARIRELIEDRDRTRQIREAIAAGHDTYGMQTFDQSLMALLKKGIITYEVAMRQSSNPDDFALRYSGISATSDGTWSGFEGESGEPMLAPSAGLDWSEAGDEELSIDGPDFELNPY